MTYDGRPNREYHFTSTIADDKEWSPQPSTDTRQEARRVPKLSLPNNTETSKSPPTSKQTTTSPLEHSASGRRRQTSTRSVDTATATSASPRTGRRSVSASRRRAGKGKPKKSLGAFFRNIGRAFSRAATAIQKLKPSSCRKVDCKRSDPKTAHSHSGGNRHCSPRSGRSSSSSSTRLPHQETLHSPTMTTSRTGTSSLLIQNSLFLSASNHCPVESTTATTTTVNLSRTGDDSAGLPAVVHRRASPSGDSRNGGAPLQQRQQQRASQYLSHDELRVRSRHDDPSAPPRQQQQQQQQKHPSLSHRPSSPFSTTDACWTSEHSSSLPTTRVANGLCRWNRADDEEEGHQPPVDHKKPMVLSPDTNYHDPFRFSNSPFDCLSPLSPRTSPVPLPLPPMMITVTHENHTKERNKLLRGDHKYCLPPPSLPPPPPPAPTAASLLCKAVTIKQSYHALHSFLVDLQDTCWKSNGDAAVVPSLSRRLSQVNPSSPPGVSEAESGVREVLPFPQAVLNPKCYSRGLLQFACLDEDDENEDEGDGWEIAGAGEVPTFFTGRDDHKMGETWKHNNLPGELHVHTQQRLPASTSNTNNKKGVQSSSSSSPSTPQEVVAMIHRMRWTRELRLREGVEPTTDHGNVRRPVVLVGRSGVPFG